MLQKLSKLLNIRRDEWPRLAVLYLMLFTFVLGIIWGDTAVRAAFLTQVGVESLSWFFMIRAPATVIGFAIYVAVADRISNTRLLLAILLLASVGIVVGLVLLAVGQPMLAYPLLFVLRFVPLMDIFAVHWFTYVSGFYDTRASKRIIPVLETAGLLGAIVAGSTTGMLAGSPIVGTPGIVGLWLLSMLVVAGLAVALPRLVARPPASGGVQRVQTPITARLVIDDQPTSYLGNIRQGYQYVVGSAFLRWLAAATLLLLLLLPLLEYATSQLLLEQLQTQEAITGFTGWVVLVANLLILPVQLVLISRIIGRLGLANATLIFPFGLLAIALTLVAPLATTVALPSTAVLAIVALVYFGRNDFYVSFGYPLIGLLYNAVPLRVKGRARAFINGLLGPLGMFCAGLLLLTPLRSIAWMLAALIGVAALAYALISFVISRQYSRALVRLLAEEDLSFLLQQQESPVMVTDPATLVLLQERLDASTSHEFTIFMARFISQVAGGEALPMLAKIARTTDAASVRVAVLDTLIASDVRSDAVRQLYTDFLSDAHPRVRQAAIAGLEHLDGPRDWQFIARALAMVVDPEAAVRLQILAALARSGTLYNHPAASATLDQLLTSADPQQRSQGLDILGQIADQRATLHLVDYLADPADVVRLKAAVLLEALPDARLTAEVVDAIRQHIPHLASDPVERVRQASLCLLEQAGSIDAAAPQVLIESLGDSAPLVRQTAAAALARVGRGAIPPVMPLLETGDLQRRKMAAVVLCRIDSNEFSSLIEGHISQGNLPAIYAHYGLLAALEPFTGQTSSLLLQAVLRERTGQLIDETFYLLTAQQAPETIKIITDSLKSRRSHIRANALEALEAITTPQTARLIGPLFDPDMSPAELLVISKQAWGMHPPTTRRAAQELYTSEDPWLRAIMTFALAEIGAAQPSPPDQASEFPAPEGKPAAKAPGTTQDEHIAVRRLSDAFKAFIIHESQSEPVGGTPPARSGSRPGAPATEPPLTRAEIEALLHAALHDPASDVSLAARNGLQMLAGLTVFDTIDEEGRMLSTIERIIFLKEVPFFQGMTIEQLRILATVCEEERFAQDATIVEQGDPGGTLYVIVTGRVGIEQSRRRGYTVRVATLGVRSYFGESNLFDNTPHSAAAIAIQEALTLQLRREPLIALARQYPELSLELIQVLGQRLREANDRIAELTRSRPRELHKLFDQYE